MTKAEQKKAETAMRKNFKRSAFRIVVDSISEAYVEIDTAPEIKITTKNSNRYIKFHSYGRDFNVLIFRDGNVDIEFKETCHYDRKYRLFEYTQDIESQNAFLETFRMDMKMVITETTRADWHIVMDFLPLEAENWREAFIDSLEVAVNSKEPLLWKSDWVSKYKE